MFGNGNFPWIAKFSRFHKTLNQNLVTFWSAGSDYTAHYSYILTTAQRYCKVHYDLKDVNAVNISVKDTVLECTECTLRTLFLPECARGACDIMYGMYSVNSLPTWVCTWFRWYQWRRACRLAMAVLSRSRESKRRPLHSRSGPIPCNQSIQHD